MASTYTQFLRLTLPTTGELSGTWGATVNAGVTQMVEEAIAGRVSIAMADADYTPTALNGTTDQARNMVLRFTGALTANRNIIVPTHPKLYIVENATTGGFALTVKTSAGTGVPVPMGEALPLRCDGTNVVLLFSPRLDGVQTYLGSVAGTDNITGTLTPTLTAYRAGQEFKFVAAGGNTGAVTLNVDGLGAKAVTKGTTALTAGELSSGFAYNVIYDGTRFQITGTTFAVTASTAATATGVALATDGTAAVHYPVFSLTPTGTSAIKTNAELQFYPSTGALSSQSFVSRALGGLQFGGSANAGVYHDATNMAIRPAGSGSLFFQRAGGTFTTATLDTNGNFVATANVTAYSDERVKTNWRGFAPDFLQRLARVKMGVYDRTDVPSTQVGVSAQSLREVLPDAVMEDSEGRLSVAYGNAALAACVMLARKVEELERRLSAFEG